MTSLSFILASLRHHRRIHLAVAAGVAVATAVITGALLVGDSVRGSLRQLTLERLGRIEAVLVAAQPFRLALADEFAARSAQVGLPSEVVPLGLVRGTLKSTGSEPRIATNLSIVGCPDEFWTLGSGGPDAPLAKNEVAVTAVVAEELGAKVGDELLLRLPATGTLPGDSTLADKDDTTVSRRFKLVAILPGVGLDRFSLVPTQQRPRNVFLRLDALGDLLEWKDQANALAVAPQSGDAVDSQQFWDALRELPLQPRMEDLGLVAGELVIAPDTQPLGVQVTSRSMVLPDEVLGALYSLYGAIGPQPVVTYLANTLEVGGRKIPYSTISGVDSLPLRGPLFNDVRAPIEIADDEIVLNDWAANDLEAKVGDEVTVTYYEPETTHGNLRVAEPVRLRIKAIVPLADLEGRPTAAADPTLTPELPGVTDQESISDWDLPFELVETIRDQDEDYWDAHRTTPKAFVSLALAERLWHTRWGTVSAVRLLGPNVAEVEQKLPEVLHSEQLGLIWLPVKLQGLEAARGTTGFAGLFLGFSFFLMASAVLLVALLFRLGIESRAAELGTLAAVGCGAGKLRQLLVSEAAIVALIGAAIGVPAGIGYAMLMIHGLSTWWVKATVSPFLRLHVELRSLAIGFASGLVVALLTTVWSLRKTVRLPVRQLLGGDASDSVDKVTSGRPRRSWLPPALLVAALGLAGFATRLAGESQAGAFFGGGALVLVALLIWLGQRLRAVDSSPPASLSLSQLAARNARRNPSRTTLTVGLAAVASFLIVALSAFRLTPTEQGVGGYDLVATSDQPIHYNFGTAAGREELGFSDAENERLAGMEVVSLRVHAGEDASCLNLYQATQPRVVGVPTSIASSKFGWGGVADAGVDPWQLLDRDLGTDELDRPVVPVILDKNTATYSLHLKGVGSQLSIQDAQDLSVTSEVVGLLGGSILQGDVLMSEANFLQLFPDDAGHELFLIKARGQDLTELQTTLESRLQDFGFDAVLAREKLADFMAVQNTYLSTFQSLGALGLLLGTFGLAVAQLRSVIERRGELALLRSTGFARGRLAELVLGENMVLLAAGLGIGTLSALAAVLPHWWLGAADVPWLTLAVLLAVVVAAGVAAGGLAVRAAVGAPLLPALRGD